MKKKRFLDNFVRPQSDLVSIGQRFHQAFFPILLLPFFLKIDKLDHETNLFSDTFVIITWPNFLLDRNWCNNLKLFRYRLQFFILSHLECLGQTMKNICLKTYFFPASWSNFSAERWHQTSMEHQNLKPALSLMLRFGH